MCLQSFGQHAIIEHELWVLNSLQINIKVFSFQDIRARYFRKYTLFFMLRTSYCCHIWWNFTFLYGFSKKNVKANFMVIRSLGAKLLPKSDGRREKQCEFKSCFSQFCERAYNKSLSMVSGSWSLLSLHC